MQYLFRWDEIPGEGTERFINFLIQDFGIDWAKNAKIEKIDGGNAIIITTDTKYLSLRLDDEKTKATLSIDFIRKGDFIVKTENGSLNVYKMQRDMQYLYSLKNYLIAITGIFIISMIIGLIVSASNPALSENYLGIFKNSFSWIKTLNPIVIMFVIFLNNAFKSLLALVLGVGLGIIPVLFVAGNGIVLSILADTVSKQQGTLFVIAALLPHGIIEVPMILISAGIGLRLGDVMYLSMKGIKVDIKEELNEGLGFYLRKIVPLLFIAAMVETFVTPVIASMFMH
ncbi:Stage II sporulation protein M [uncultured archaeon]|nr:Stage II sporulation protein M [uncultured archaeon]